MFPSVAVFLIGFSGSDLKFTEVIRIPAPASVIHKLIPSSHSSTLTS